LKFMWPLLLVLTIVISLTLSIGTSI
jgi:hypothetical protein